MTLNKLILALRSFYGIVMGRLTRSIMGLFSIRSCDSQEFGLNKTERLTCTQLKSSVKSDFSYMGWQVCSPFSEGHAILGSSKRQIPLCLGPKCLTILTNRVCKSLN